MHHPAVDAGRPRPRGQNPAIGFAFALLSLLLLFPFAALAQTAAEQDPQLDAISSGFGMYRVLVYVFVAAGIAVGAFVFVLLRRRFVRLAMLFGVIAAAVTAAGGYWATLALANDDVATCANAPLNWGDRAEEYDRTCAISRERPAGALLGAPVFRFLSGVSDAEPLSGSSAWWTTMISIVVVSLLVLLLLRPLIEKRFVRN